MQIRVVNGDYAGEEIVVQNGGEFALAVWEMTGAGFDWRVETLPEGLAVVADYHLADPVQPELFPSSPVRRRFHFQSTGDKPARPCWQELTLVYERAGDPESHRERRSFQVLLG